MWDKTVIMNFSGIYPQEPFFQAQQGRWLDMTGMEGVNCYCTPEAEEAIQKQIKEMPLFGIHFLDSGNYHYLSKLWLKKIEEPFDLLVFDNHTDMQEAAFFGLLSCGSWVREVLDTNPELSKVCVTGPSKAAFSECDAQKRGITAVTAEELSQKKEETLERFLAGSSSPLYLSIDMDLLSREAARTNWDQGEVLLPQLLKMIRLAFVYRRILGADICGENPQDTAEMPRGEDLEINSRTTAGLWGCLAEEMEKQEAYEKECRSLDEKFLSGKQEKIRLELALKRYFSCRTWEKDKVRKEYGPYLSLRIRPAGEWLIQQRENRKLAVLLEDFQLQGAVLESLLLKAEKYQNTEAQIFLLQKKKEQQGFKEEGWEF